MPLRAFHNRLRRINRTRGPARSAFSGCGIVNGASPTLDDSALTIARRLWCGCRNRLCLQRSGCRSDVRCRNRPWFRGDGNFWSARFFVCHCHIDSARIPWRGPLYQIPPFQLNGNWEIVPYLLLGLAPALLRPGSSGSCAQAKHGSGTSQRRSI
jgi:hypothetical protein